MREWLPEDDLVFVALDAVAALDLGEFRRVYPADGHGGRRLARRRYATGISLLAQNGQICRYLAGHCRAPVSAQIGGYGSTGRQRHGAERDTRGCGSQMLLPAS